MSELQKMRIEINNLKADKVAVKRQLEVIQKDLNWTYTTLKDRESFGLHEEQAIKRRECRARATLKRTHTTLGELIDGRLGTTTENMSEKGLYNTNLQQP